VPRFRPFPAVSHLRCISCAAAALRERARRQHHDVAGAQIELLLFEVPERSLEIPLIDARPDGFRTLRVERAERAGVAARGAIPRATGGGGTAGGVGVAGAVTAGVGNGAAAATALPRVLTTGGGAGEGASPRASAAGVNPVVGADSSSVGVDVLLATCEATDRGDSLMLDAAGTWRACLTSAGRGFCVSIAFAVPGLKLVIPPKRPACSRRPLVEDTSSS